MAIRDPVARTSGAMICTHKAPSVSCIGTPVPETDACMPSALEHFKSDKTPSSSNVSVSLSIAPTVQAIVVNRVAIVHPQFASIVGINAEAVVARSEDSHAACPTHSKVVTATETRPIAIRVAIVDHMFPALQIGSATVQALAPAPLTEVECILPEETMAIRDPVARTSRAVICTHKAPSVSCIGTPVPETDACMPSALEHFKSDKTPSSSNVSVSFSIAPAVQAIVVNRVAIVHPQFASIVGVNAEAVVARSEDSHAACPTHSKVVTATETGPIAICVAIVHHMFPALQIRSATVQVLAPAPLTKVECILPEETMMISDPVARAPRTMICSHKTPSVSCID